MVWSRKVEQGAEAVSHRGFEIRAWVFIGEKFASIARGLDHEVAGGADEAIVVLAGNRQEFDLGLSGQEACEGGSDETVGANQSDTHGQDYRLADEAGDRLILHKPSDGFS